MLKYGKTIISACKTDCLFCETHDKHDTALPTSMVKAKMPCKLYEITCLLACLFVCLFVYPLAYLVHQHSLKFTSLPVYATCSRDSVLLWWQCLYVMHFRFVNDVQFWHNRANGPESKTAHMFRPVRQMAAPVGHQKTLFGRVRQGGGTGAKTAVFNCILCKFFFHVARTSFPNFTFIFSRRGIFDCCGHELLLMALNDELVWPTQSQVEPT